MHQCIARARKRQTAFDDLFDMCLYLRDDDGGKMFGLLAQGPAGMWTGVEEYKPGRGIRCAIRRMKLDVLEYDGQHLIHLELSVSAVWVVNCLE